MKFSLPKIAIVIVLLFVIYHVWISKRLIKNEGYTDQWTIPKFYETTNYITRSHEAQIDTQWLDKQLLKEVSTNIIREM